MANSITYVGGTYKKQFVSVFDRLTKSYSRHRVFDDFVTMASVDLSQSARVSVGLLKDGNDEQRYLSAVRRYKPDEVKGEFVEMMAALINGLEHEGGDWLGDIYCRLELGDSTKGQFFTPYHISGLMGEMACGTQEDIQKHIDARGYVTVSEPCCGAGSMVIAYSETLKKAGFNPAIHLFAVAQDLSSTAAGMCHLQLSLYGIPALVMNQNSLTSDKPFWLRYTPAFYWFGWQMRLNKTPKENSASNADSNQICDMPLFAGLS